MCRTYPQSMTSLSQIFGIGKEKLAQFGDEFLQIIQAYAKAKGIAEKKPLESKAPAVKANRGRTSTIQETLDLFADKQSISEIAALRDVTQSTVMNHLEQALEQGIKLDISHLTFPSIARFGIITKAFETAGTSMLAPVRSDLGDDYSYDEIRLVRFMLKAQKLL